MVNVNKPISKEENAGKQMPKRRPRNTELNSSKKVSVSARTRALVRNRNTAKFNPSLNSSLNCAGENSGTGWWEDDGAYYAELDAKAIGEALKAAAENADAVTPQDDDYAWTYRYDSCFVRIEDIADCDVIVGPRDYDSVDKIKKGDFDNALCYIERFLGGAESVYCYAVGRDIVEAINQQAADPYGMSYKTYSRSEQYSTTSNANSSCEDSSEELNCAANSSIEYNLSKQAMDAMIDKIYSIPSDMAKSEKMSFCRTADAKQEPVAMLIVNVLKGENDEGKRLANIQAQFPNKTVSVANSVPVTEEGLTEAFEKAKEIGEQYTDELMVNSSKELNCAAEDEVKITTESGNEVSLSDIQIIQNPSTNEISLFIKEDEDEEIPEGFTVIATAAQPALSGGDTCPECGQDPCVCEGEELDSSKKKNLTQN